MTDYKRCAHCGQEFPADLEHFPPAGRPGKLHSYCRPCKKEYARNFVYPRIRDEKNAERRNRYHTDEVYHQSHLAMKKRQWNNNHEEILSLRRERYPRIKDKVNAQRRKRFRNEPPEQKAKRKQEMREWKIKHPEWRRIHHHLRKARVHGFLANLTEKDWQVALDYFKGKCAICGRQADEKVLIVPDHWIPLSNPNCPGTTPMNIIPLCNSIVKGARGCNNLKGNRLPEIWLVEKYGQDEAKSILQRIERYFMELQNIPLIDH